MFACAIIILLSALYMIEQCQYLSSTFLSIYTIMKLVKQ